MDATLDEGKELNRKIFVSGLLLSLVLVGSFSTPVFAEDGDCWFIFCIFEKIFEPKPKEPKLEEAQTIEEAYVAEAKKGKQKMIEKLKDEVSMLKDAKKTTENPYLQDAIQQDIDLYEEILYTEKDIHENPEKYYTQKDLINIAVQYYKVKPDGTLCDDDRVWIDERSICMREGSAIKKHIQYYDLEWLRYYEFDTSIMETKK